MTMPEQMQAAVFSGPGGKSLESVDTPKFLQPTDTSANSYLIMHSARLKEMGVKEVRGQIFDGNIPLSAINKGPVV